MPDNVDDIVADIAQEEKEEGLCFHHLHQELGSGLSCYKALTLWAHSINVTYKPLFVQRGVTMETITIIRTKNLAVFPH